MTTLPKRPPDGLAVPVAVIQTQKATEIAQYVAQAMVSKLVFSHHYQFWEISPFRRIVRTFSTG